MSVRLTDKPDVNSINDADTIFVKTADGIRQISKADLFANMYTKEEVDEMLGNINQVLESLIG